MTIFTRAGEETPNSLTKKTWILGASGDTSGRVGCAIL